MQKKKKVLLHTVSLQNSYVEPQAPTVTIFGDVSSKQVIKAKWGYKGGLWPNRISVSI